MKSSIIIPNWNGRRLLEKNLPAVLREAGEAEVIVVDDVSPDDSSDFLSKNYPEIKVVKHQRNLGFGAACNSGVKEAKGEIVVLLNLDVVPEKDSLKNILPDFEDEKVFAVSFHEPNWSWARIFWKNGFIEHEPGIKTDKVHISGWASGGSAAFRKSIWEKLGGFDEIYKPFYWEDIDLSYRAWKRGYKILWEPKAIVYHEHQSVIGRHFSKEYVDFISQRNRLIFIWKNITDLQMMIEHKLHLLGRLKSLGYFKPLLAAKLKSPKIMIKKWKEWREQKVTDKEIFKMFA